jgi:hypothetical protein
MPEYAQPHGHWPVQHGNRGAAPVEQAGKQTWHMLAPARTLPTALAQRTQGPRKKPISALKMRDKCAAKLLLACVVSLAGSESSIKPVVHPTVGP